MWARGAHPYKIGLAVLAPTIKGSQSFAPTVWARKASPLQPPTAPYGTYEPAKMLRWYFSRMPRAVLMCSGSRRYSNASNNSSLLIFL